MRVEPQAIADVKLLHVARHADARGFFSETWNARRIAEAIGEVAFVQDNHVLTRASRTFRGFHFQIAPAAQAKLIRVCAGRIFDVSIDLRVGSPTYGRHVAVTLSRESWTQLWIPAGFAHGYLTLEPDTEVLYKASTFYAPELERGLRWNDPALGIEWPIASDAILANARDNAWPMLADLPRHFASSDVAA